MKRVTSLCAIALLFVGATPSLASAQKGAKPGAEKKDEPATVLTYYGLRKKERDPNVSDEEKLRDWQAFIERTKDQVKYAKKAVEFWKNAARLRVIESVQKADQSESLSPAEKMQKWQNLLDLYPKSKEARIAKKRVAYWRAEETKRLVLAAEEIEKSSEATKVERIKAWREVKAWTDRGPEAKAAARRIAALEEQLFDEAQSLDKIERIDAKTKLAVWKDVLAADPVPKKKKLAERRIAELEKELGGK